uniref:Uncharacterized protein n=1 Tax=Cacopsylla melanoneura TaxID=428564 RepID=A0A8D8X7U4_9HEMI
MISAPSWLRLSAEPPHAVSPPMCARSRLAVTQLLELVPLPLEPALLPLEMALLPLETALIPLEMATLPLALVQSSSLHPTPSTFHAMSPPPDSNSSRPVPAARPSLCSPQHLFLTY